VVVLIGDPLRNPADPVRTMRLGTAALAGRGNGGVGARFPDAVRGEVLEVCAHGDDVCNAPPAGRVGPPSTTHRTTYKHRATQGRIALEAAGMVVGGGG
jgi:cutinase